MRILITGARAPVALELVRALGRAGHTVYAADSMAPTLAGSSRYAAGALLLPPARTRPDAFAEAVGAHVARLGIELAIPTCEEVFYLARAHAALSARTRLLCEPLPALARWHNKGTFQRHAEGLGLQTPRTVVVRSRAELDAALPAFPRFLLKPAFSRFATKVITNCGPHADRRPLDFCAPTPQTPWLVQAFVEGEAVCSYSILHAGHITAHCAYTTPARVGLGSGTAFVSAQGAQTLAVVQRLAGAGFTGQLSLDFIRTPEGELYLLECNPRATSGAHLIAPRWLVGGLLDPQQPTWVEPPEQRRQITLATLPYTGGRVLRRPLDWQRWRELAAAACGGDVILSARDPLPTLAQLPQLLRFAAISRRKRIGLLAATTDDLEWNGDAAFLAPES